MGMFNYQWVAIVLVLVFAARLRVFKKNVPGALLCLACLAFLAIFSISHTTWFVHRKGALLVSPFEADQLEIKSRLFRESLNRSLQRLPRKHTSRWAIRSPWPVSSYSAATRLLQSSPNGSAVLWLAKGQLNLALRDLGVVSLSGLDPHISIDQIRELKVVPAPPLINFSLEPELDSVRYLARVFGGYSESNPETLYRDAAFYNARWRSFSHKSAAGFMLGNYYLMQSINGGAIELGELKCAINTYQKALRYIRPKENTAVLAALLNNFGVASYISSIVSGKTREKQHALKYFAAAFRMRSAYNPNGVPLWGADAAIQNLGFLKHKKALKLLGTKNRRKGAKNHGHGQASSRASSRANKSAA